MYDGGFLTTGSGKYRKEFGNLWCSSWIIGEKTIFFEVDKFRRLFIVLIFVAVEKQGFPHHHTYNSKAGVNFRFGMIYYSF